MQNLAVNGYTAQQIDDALHAKYRPRNIKFKYDLLDKNEIRKSTLSTVVSASIAMQYDADIKRTAKFKIEDDGTINWLSDRVQPFFMLKMPDIKVPANNCLQFDGSTGYVNLNSPAALNLGNTFTVEVKFKPTNLTGRSALYTCRASGDAGAFQLEIGSGSGTGLENNTVGVTTPGTWIAVAPTNSITLGQINHVAYTKSGTALGGQKLIVNGVSQALVEELAYTILDNANPKYIGGVPAGGQDFQGTIYEVRVWSIARTPTDIQANINTVLIGSEPGLVACYRLQENSGLVINDISPNHILGSLSSGVTWLQDTTLPYRFVISPSQWIQWSLGIFLLSSPTRIEENNKIYRDVDCYDGLQVLKDDKFALRYTILAGADYYASVIAILQSSGITKYNIQQINKLLPITKEWEPGTSKLDALNDLLSDLNFTPIWVDEIGFYTSQLYQSPSVRASNYTYTNDQLSIMYNGLQDSLDLFSVPNSWVVVASNADTGPLTSTYTNNNPNSSTSTVSRGRTIIDYETIDSIADQASLDAYVQTLAFQASQVFGEVDFDTALMPMHSYNDILQIIYSYLNISDKYSETGWSMELAIGGKMQHNVRKVVQI